MKKICIQDEKIIHILTDIYELLEKSLLKLPEVLSVPAISTKKEKEGIKPANAYSEAELVTIKEAGHMLGVSRWKIAKMRDDGELTTLDRNGRKRLIRKEVEGAKIWYSIPRGKL